MKLITYCRVSTRQQGRSGLGLEAQRAAVDAYTDRMRGKVIRAFVEVESGKDDRRPELAKALHLARVTGATLVIAKLDRLSRHATFLLTLRDSGVRFIAADMPDANELTVGIMALVAQQEREAISRRTREALAAAKRRGTKLGNPNGARALRRAKAGNGASLSIIRAKADRHAANLRSEIEKLRERGATSLGQIAKELNDQEILTPRKATWHKTSVRNLLQRLKATA